MKKIISVIVFLIFIVGCTADVTNNPTSLQDNANVNANLKTEKINLGRIKYDDILPEAMKFLEAKEKEHNIKINPGSKTSEPKIVDITKIPGIVIPTLSDIEKLSPGNENIFQGIILKKFQIHPEDYLKKWIQKMILFLVIIVGVFHIQIQKNHFLNTWVLDKVQIFQWI